MSADATEHAKSGRSAEMVAHYCLRPGTCFSGIKGKYEIISTIRHLKYGDVYKAKSFQKNDFVIVKTENDTVPEDLARLKKEVGLLQDVEKDRQKPNSGRFQQFPSCLDRGKAEFKFVVLKIVGPDLHFLRSKILKKNFSKSTALRIAQWSLQAIIDLHELGWIHRDIRPANFWTGYGAHHECIFLLDFQKIRQVVRKGRHLRKREGVQTDVRYQHLKYLSRSGIQGLDQSRRDDYEMWAYMVIDLFDQAALPWKDLKGPDIIKSKTEFFINKKVREAVLHEIPDFEGVIDYIGRMRFIDEGRPSLFKEYLIAIRKRLNINLNEPLDWNNEAAVQHPVASFDTSTYPHIDPVDQSASGTAPAGSKENRSMKDQSKRRKKSRNRTPPPPQPKNNADDEDDFMDPEALERAYVRAESVVKGLEKRKPKRCQDDEAEPYDNMLF